MQASQSKLIFNYYKVYISTPLFSCYLYLTGKPAAMSTQVIDIYGYSVDAQKAVDGVYLPSDSIYSSLAYSGDVFPWWRVDLGDVHCVWAVNIFNKPKKRNNVINLCMFIFSVFNQWNRTIILKNRLWLFNKTWHST